MSQTQTRRSSQVDLLHGSILKSLLLFALPIMASRVFQQIYNTMDTLIVGYTLGDSSIAAMGACSSIYEMMTGFTFGVGNGLAIVTARCFGRQETERMKKSVASCIVIGVAVTLVVTILATIFMHPLLRLLKTPAEILEESYSYISILSIFLFVMFAYNLCSGLLRAIGNSFMPLVFLIFSSLVNIVLDLLFIRTFGMGVRGAAIATVIAQGISVVLCLIYIVTKAKILLPEKRHFEPDRGLYADLLAQGFSMGFMSSIIYVGSIVLQPGINSLGYETIAGHTAARKLFSFSMMPLSSMAQAVNTYVAQNRGADNRERVHKGIRYAYLFCFSVTIALIICVTPFAPTLVHLISGSSDPTVLGNGARYLRVAIPFFFALGLVNCSRLALQALGEKILPLLSSFIELFGKIIFAMVFIPRYHYSAVIWCEPIIWCFMAAELVISLYRNPYMRKGKAGN